MKIIVCDDDIKMQFMLRQWVEEYLEGQNCQFIFYQTGAKLLDDMSNLNISEPQIVFMDIKLKNDNGIEVARLLNKEYGNTAIIFISGYTEYIEDSFEADPIYFLVKPLKKEAFKKAMDKAVYKLSQSERQSFFVAQDRVLRRVFLQDIYYAESAGRKVRLHGSFGVIEYYEKMAILEKQLGENFVRSHKSFLVHMKYVHSIEGKNITMMDGSVIPVSRKMLMETRKAIFEYLERKL